MTLSPQEILRQYGITLESYTPGRYYTICPNCSKDRHKKNLKCVGVTIVDGESVHFGCNHCPLKGPEKGSGNGHDLTTHDYVDADGKLLFQKVRNVPGREPRFWCRRPNGHDGWINDTKGINNKLLYRWPEIVKAMKEDREIAIVEGEKDADRLWSIGISATCNFDGATDVIKHPKAQPKWKAAYSAALRGARIVVFNDNDPPGYAHADTVCKLSLGVAARVRRLDLKIHWPEIPQKADVSDWLARGHSRQELDALIAQATEYAPQPQEVTGGLEDDIALDFAARHADDHRYIAKTGQWMHWTGTRWQQEDTLAAFDVSRALCRQAGDANAKTVAAVIALARTDRRIAAVVEQWDANPDLLNCGSTVVDLKTGEQRPPRRDDYCTKQTSIAPAAPGTPCDLFNKFLDKITNKDDELIGFLQRYLGYCLTGHTREHVFVFCYGTGANGKSTFIKTIASILADYCATSPIEMFLASRQARPHIGSVHGAYRSPRSRSNRTPEPAGSAAILIGELKTRALFEPRQPERPFRKRPNSGCRSAYQKVHKGNASPWRRAKPSPVKEKADQHPVKGTRSNACLRMIRPWYVEAMKGRAILGYFLALLAIGGLALAPMVRSAMAMPATAHSSMAQPMAAAPAGLDDMPCCPHKPSLPDCSKDCPLMALCVIAPLYFASQTGLVAPLTFAGIVFPGDQSDLVSVADAPLENLPKSRFAAVGKS